MTGIHKLSSSGGLLVNYRCQAVCGHCRGFCAPTRCDDYLSPEGAVRIFRRVRELGTHCMHISGGEPFIHPEKLLAVLAAAREEGMEINYIETSASWVHDLDEAADVFARVKEMDVQIVSLAASPYHNSFITADQLLGCIAACRKVGMGTGIWTDEFLPDITAMPTDRTHDLSEYIERYGKDYLVKMPGRYALTMTGRAVATHRDTMPLCPTSRIPHMCRSCQELGERSHYHVDLYGNYIPPGCFGLGLPLEALGKELDAEEFPIAYRLMLSPKQLLDYCKSLGFQPAGSHYNRCHLCQEMRYFLWKKFPGRYRELAPEGFYEQMQRETEACTES